MADVIIVGGGVFGWTTACTLLEQGAAVTVVEPGQPLAEDAASEDINKMVRLEYGADPSWLQWAEDAIAGWEHWNTGWDRPLYHSTGVLFLCAQPLDEAGFEGDSRRALVARGHVLPGHAVPGPWQGFAEAYTNPVGGWVESGAVVRSVACDAVDAGVVHLQGRAVDVGGGQVRLDDGVRLEAPQVVVAAGSWTPDLVPETRQLLRATSQMVLHFAPEDTAPFDGRTFPAWAADVAHTGWYGFPRTRQGIVKVGHHGPGIDPRPDRQQAVAVALEERCRAFLSRSLPVLAAAPLERARVCRYCDTPDGDFLIDALPDDPRTFVAAGGSGHAFKFAPLLGRWVADALQGQGPQRFLWREAKTGQDAARASGTQ